LTPDEEDPVPEDPLTAIRFERDAVTQAEEAHAQALDDLRESVQEAKRAGHSWAEVAEVLGVSRQSAQQRFGRERVDLSPKPPTPAPVPQGTRRKPRSKR
jgi:DNA-directed RNA polymerase specialized sigma24 family protein